LFWLQANTTLTRLELPKCDAAVASAVASLLHTNTTLQVAPPTQGSQ
jgi:hypothetical protein